LKAITYLLNAAQESEVASRKERRRFSENFTRYHGSMTKTAIEVRESLSAPDYFTLSGEAAAATKRSR
jgi:hypothetical protein